MLSAAKILVLFRVWRGGGSEAPATGTDAAGGCELWDILPLFLPMHTPGLCLMIMHTF